MVLVTDPGTYNAVYPQLLHAPWSGATATDMIFPCFLVITGLAMTLSLAARLGRGASERHLLLHILRRSALLCVLGLALNAFPSFHLATLRIPGILQRIALCYLAGGLIYLGTRRTRIPLRALVLWIAALLASYWLAITYIPVPGFGPAHLDTNGNLGAYLDRAVFGIPHLWPWGLTPGVGVTFDPEGLLSTIPALATLLMGVLAGEWMRTASPLSDARRISTHLALAGSVLFALGLALHPVLPIIKKIWTPSFALLSGGFALVAFALLHYLIDVRHWRAWTRPACVFGLNAILAFALSTILTATLDAVHLGPTPLHQWLYEHLFATWLPPVNASLAYALAIVLLNLALLTPLHRRRIFIRI